MKPVLVALLLSAPLACVHGQSVTNVTGAKITEVGIFRARVVKGANVQGGWQADGADAVSWVQFTTNIPPRAGFQFGFRYNISGSPTNAPIEVQVVHEQPQYRDPANPLAGTDPLKTATKIQSKIGQSYLLYTLEKEDLIPGKWKFDIYYGDKLLCEQGFLVGLVNYQYRPPASRTATNSMSTNTPARAASDP